MERQLGDEEYQRLVKHYQKDILPPTHRATQTVNRVGSRIALAANQFAQDNLRNPRDVLGGSPYTYTVVRSDMANAFVLPNNHVFVLTGLFECVRDEDELAAVLGHEMAHNLARHAGERLSSNVLLGILARTSLILDPSGILYTILIPTLKVVRELPHSRDHEVEADYIGLHLASEACFDPRAAKRVFTSMKDTMAGRGTAPPEFLSSHPSYDTRVSNFETWMPEAMEKFQKGKCRNVREVMKEARMKAAMQATKREKGTKLV